MQGFGPALFTFEWRASARSLAARQYRRLANEVAKLHRSPLAIVQTHREVDRLILAIER